MNLSTASKPFARAPHRARAGIAVVVIAATFALAGCMSTQQQTAFQLVQDSRSHAGIHGLSHDSVAQDKAQAWAERLASKNTLAHSNLSSGMDGGWSLITENVGYGSSIEAVHRQFMDSSSHRANILDRRMTHLGVGVAQGHGRTFVVQVFVRR